MAKFSTREHSKTLGKTQIPNFSTLASTLNTDRLETSCPLPLLGTGRDRQSTSLFQRDFVQKPS